MMRFILGMVSILVIILSLAAAEVQFNEIMYDVNGPDTGHEWIEIANTGSSEVNLTLWKLNEQGTNHNLNLIAGSSTLAAGEFAVIADDAALFQQDYPDFVGTLFDSVFSLSNAGEYLALYNGSHNINAVNYSSSWGGGNGYSLERFNAAWNTSLAPKGTPGKENSIIPNSIVPCVPNLILLVSDWLNETACLLNDTYSQNRTIFQYDENNCRQNQTWTESQALSCDYCTPSWIPVNSSCSPNDGIVQWHNDSNRCYEQTALTADLADMPANITHSLVCDYDADGFIGNISDIDSSLTLNWERQASSLIFREGNKTLVEFPVLEGVVNFRDLFIEKQPNGSAAGYVLIRGWLLGENQTKTIHLDALNRTSNAVCIKDAEVNSISEMSASCSGENETIILCNGELQGRYRCTGREGFILSGTRHSAVQEFYAAPVPSAPVPDDGDAAAGSGGGGGGGGSSCPPGRILQKGKCVAAAIIQSNPAPSEEEAVEKLEESMPGGIVEKEIQMSFSKAKPVSPKPLLTNIPFGSEITGAAAGVSEKSLKVVPLLVISALVIVGGGIVWVIHKK